MNILLEEYYRNDIHQSGFIERKASLNEESVWLCGIAQSGKTALIKNYLLSHKKSTYLYLDCRDIRLEIRKLNEILEPFCRENKIKILALDNYREEINLFDMGQIILSSEFQNPTDFEMLTLNLLDFEEFLAFEPKYDSTALNHFFLLGGFPAMQNVVLEDRPLYLQRTLSNALNEIELSLLIQATKMVTQKVSAYTLYERLKEERKISKDKLYACFRLMLDKRYLYGCEKFNHPSAIKKLYLCDIAIKHALTLQKHFGKVFENLIFLELIKHEIECYYDEGIDFYLPQRNQIILASAFANEHALFKKVEALEGFIIMYQVKEIVVVTMNLESTLSHPIARIELIPFSQWALGEE
ncbi:MAG: ATP-binding protein [Campylobacterales bacterium]|nr:ATP-binding protein [Campylobacterales bacterium]